MQMARQAPTVRGWATTSAPVVSPLHFGPEGELAAAGAADVFSGFSAATRLRCVEERLLVIYCVIASENYISVCVLERRSDCDIHGRIRCPSVKLMSSLHPSVMAISWLEHGIVSRMDLALHARATMVDRILPISGLRWLSP
eukprot:jgi/Mesvir1/17205/Mv26419-RA.1